MVALGGGIIVGHGFETETKEVAVLCLKYHRIRLCEVGFEIGVVEYFAT